MVFKKEQDMAVLMLEKTIDTEKAKKLQEDISELQGKMAQKRLQAQIDSRKVLTPEQIGQLPPGCPMGVGPDGMGCGFGPHGNKGDGGRRK